MTHHPENTSSPWHELRRYGWNDSWEVSFRSTYGEEFVPGRITSATKGHYSVVTAGGPGLARITGAFEYRCAFPSDYPAVGDWAVVEEIDNPSVPFQIHGILPRTNALSRKRAGSGLDQQVLAANVDIVFIVFSLEGGRKCSPRAAERYATMVWESGATPVMLLNKLDVCDNPTSVQNEIESAAPGVDVLFLSCLTREGIGELTNRLNEGETFALVGPSGTGKSTIINTLLGEEMQDTGEIRKGDMKGRHTTTRRELIPVPQGALLLDTPGLRELALWGGADSLDESFSDITELARQCRFNDCSHTGEPGCAVQSALEEGHLDADRFENFLDLMKELEYLNRRTDVQAERDYIDRWKKISKDIRRIYKERGK